MRRWVIYLDIEGFSVIYRRDEYRAINALGTVMQGIYRIGMTVCRDTPLRLFVHQTGDGFVIVSESDHGMPRLPVAVAIILMRQVLAVGCLAKAGVSVGEFADMRSCYPDVIQGSLDSDGVVKLGNGGVLRIFTSMGTALINAHSLTSAKRGALLLLDATDPLDSSIKSTVSDGVVVVDWVHADMPEIREIAEAATIALPDTVSLEGRLRAAVEAAKDSVGEEWVQNTLTFNGCD